MQRARGRLGLVGVAHDGLGADPPGLHGQRRVPHRQGGQGRHQGVLVVGEEGGGPLVHVGHHGLHLAAREHTLLPGLGRDRRFAQARGRAGHGRRRGGAHAPVVAQPRRHGGGPVALPGPVVVEVAHRFAQACPQAIEQRQGLGQLGAGKGALDFLDSLLQRLQHGSILRRGCDIPPLDKANNHKGFLDSRASRIGALGGDGAGVGQRRGPARPRHRRHSRRRACSRPSTASRRCSRRRAPSARCPTLRPGRRRRPAG